MQKRLFIVMLLLFIAVSGLNAQNNDTITTSNFTHQQWEQWNKIETEWRTAKFYPFLKKHKLKNSCAHCYSIHFEVLFKIDSLGNNTPILIKTYACGKPFTGKQKKEMIILLSTIVFPVEFRNGLLKMRIGNTLKC